MENEIDFDWEFSAPHWVNFEMGKECPVDDTWFDTPEAYSLENIRYYRKRSTLPTKITKSIREEFRKGNENVDQNNFGNYNKPIKKEIRKSIESTATPKQKIYTPEFQSFMRFRGFQPW